MKIECTSKEKELLIDIFVDSGFCHFDFTYCCNGNLCKECYEQNIEWKIKEGD